MAMPERKRVAERLHSAALHLLRRLREVDAGAAVGPARLSVLSVLVFGGSATIGDLAAKEHVRPPTMSKIVSGLEELGLVTRRPGSDRRAVILAVTAAGRKLLLQARDRRLERFSAMLASATPGELTTLEKSSAILERLLNR
jgi:DNA-binding MarR family transcriptional regulator